MLHPLFLHEAPLENVKQTGMKTPTWSPWLVLLLLAIPLLSHPQPARAVGPNMLGNSSFEGGTFGYWQLDRDPYSVVKNPANAHSGSWAVKAGVQDLDTSFSLRAPLRLWPDTSYTCLAVRTPITSATFTSSPTTNAKENLDHENRHLQHYLSRRVVQRRGH